jgi:hypothetical protein
VLPVAQQVEHRKAVGIHDDRLAIDEAGLNGQRGDRRGNQGKTVGEVIAFPGKQPHAFFVGPRH